MSVVLERQTAETAVDLARRVRAFVDGELVPRERELGGGGSEADRCLHELAERARSQGLWAVHRPAELGGRGLSLRDYLLVAEQEGRSIFGPAVLGADVVLDAHMLHRHGSPEVRRRYLEPLLAGEAVPSYGMTEPGRSGSDPSLMVTKADLVDGTWTVSGRKWWISNAGRAAFTTVVARTEGLGRPPRQGFSMIVVPTDAPGFRVVRPLDVLGAHTGQYEIALDGVRVDADHLLGPRGAGLPVAGERLGLGRMLRAMHWLGQAQRAFDLMCHRLTERATFSGRLADKQLMHQHVFDACTAITSARSLVRSAAAGLDAGRSGATEVSIAKVTAARAVQDVLDRAVQVFGAEGLCGDTPLSAMYRAARSTRILDGPDELHVTTTAHRILKGFADRDTFDFTDTLDVGDR
ncbi:MAG: acyl-CoA dehydrogenase family protein [Pseudonocardia sp.]